MKKRIVFVLVIFFMVSTACFAQGFEIGGAGFLLSGRNVSIKGGGLNIAGTGYITDVVGYGVYGNIMYGSFEGVTLIPIDLLVGPAFKLVKADHFALPLAFGLYMVDAFAFSGNAAKEGFNIGAGGNISAEFRFSESVFLYLRLQAAYGFLGGGDFMFSPAIGIGF